MVRHTAVNRAKKFTAGSSPAPGASFQILK